MAFPGVLAMLERTVEVVREEIAKAGGGRGKGMDGMG